MKLLDTAATVAIGRSLSSVATGIPLSAVTAWVMPLFIHDTSFYLHSNMSQIDSIPSEVAGRAHRGHHLYTGCKELLFFLRVSLSDDPREARRQGTITEKFGERFLLSGRLQPLFKSI